MRKNRIELKWCKKENDWIFHYPDNIGSTMMGVFFDMVKTTGNKTDWHQELIDMLADCGYDYKTFRIICNKIK